MIQPSEYCERRRSLRQVAPPQNSPGSSSGKFASADTHTPTSSQEAVRSGPGSKEGGRLLGPLGGLHFMMMPSGAKGGERLEREEGEYTRGKVDQGNFRTRVHMYMLLSYEWESPAQERNLEAGRGPASG